MIFFEIWKFYDFSGSYPLNTRYLKILTNDWWPHKKKKKICTFDLSERHKLLNLSNFHIKNKSDCPKAIFDLTFSWVECCIVLFQSVVPSTQAVYTKATFRIIAFVIQLWQNKILYEIMLWIPKYLSRYILVSVFDKPANLNTGGNLTRSILVLIRWLLTSWGPRY